MDRKQPIIAILTDRYFQYQAEIIEGLTTELAAAGYGSLCVAGRELSPANTIQPTHSVCNAIYTQIEDFDVRGIIALSGTLGHGVDTETITEFVNRYSLPLVSIGMDIPNRASVYLDENRGMADLMEHLLCCGTRKRFAFVRGHKNDLYSKAREKIFRDSLLAHKHKLDQCYFLEGDYNAFTTYQASTEMLRTATDVDCIVAANDVMAASSARAAKALGLSIPNDIWICGFDDSSEATRHSPALSTVRQPMTKMAQECVVLLLEQIDNQSRAEPTPLRSVRCDTELIVRRSTNPSNTNSALQGTFDESALHQLLVDAMDGLDTPETLSIQDISKPLWNTIEYGSVELLVLTENLSDAVISQNSHWWINLVDQIHSVSNQILTGERRNRHLAMITSAISKVKERIWAIEMDRQFEASRLQNVRSDMFLEMTSCSNVDHILKAMDRWLLKLNPHRCFLVRYQSLGSTPDAEAELLHHFKNGKVAHVDAARFKSNDILPDEYKHELTNGLLVLSPLYADNNLFGYLLIDPTDMDLLYIDAAAQAISNAMRTHYHIGVLQSQTKKLESVNGELANLANFDALTGLSNRLQFQHYLERCCTSAKGLDSYMSFALLFIDLDGFKLINDTLGHSVGDSLLNDVAQRLLNRATASTDYDGFISRLGGDEFTVILHPKNASADIHAISKQFLQDLSDPYQLNENNVSISASIGGAFFPEDAANADALVRHADIAMYTAKDNGKNTIAFFTPEMINADNHELQLAQELRNALDNDLLEMHFQPRIDLATGKMCAAEALIRWIISTPDGKKPRSFPDVFIPLAEKIGVISQLDTYALNYSCKQAAQWSEAGTPLTVSVNVSVKQLQQDSFVKTVATALATHKLQPDLLELEITETAAMTDVEHNIRKLSELKAMGIKVSIDDFGTGYSSLNYLKRLPVDNLKIDRSFIMDIVDADGGDSADAAIVRSVVALGKGMGFGLIAEGIETAAQTEFVRSLGCDEVQGYLYSKPVTAIELTSILDADYPFIDMTQVQHRAA